MDHIMHRFGHLPFTNFQQNRHAHANACPRGSYFCQVVNSTKRAKTGWFGVPSCDCEACTDATEEGILYSLADWTILSSRGHVDAVPFGLSLMGINSRKLGRV